MMYASCLASDRTHSGVFSLRSLILITTALASAATAVVYGLLAVDFSLVRTIEIEQMDLVTNITEAPGTGTLWVAGFCKTGSAAYGATDVSYSPHLATIPTDATTVQAPDLAQQDEHNLVLPTSIVWTGKQ